MIKSAARTILKSSGLLLFAYAAIFATAHAKGYYFRLSDGPLHFKTVSGQRYALFEDGNFPSYGVGWGVYGAAGSTGFFWKRIPNVEIGFSYNDQHMGTDLVFSPDQKLLFVRRNTDGPDLAIWSDVLDLTSDPPRSIIRGPDCCTEPRPDAPSTTDSDGLKRHGVRVRDMARVAGAAD